MSPRFYEAFVDELKKIAEYRTIEQIADADPAEVKKPLKRRVKTVEAKAQV